jgi:hypothetical protein
LGPGLACIAVRALYAFVPYRIVVKVDRRLGEFTRTARALFRSSEKTEKLEAMS